MIHRRNKAKPPWVVTTESSDSSGATAKIYSVLRPNPTPSVVHLAMDTSNVHVAALESLLDLEELLTFLLCRLGRHLLKLPGGELEVEELLVHVSPAATEDFHHRSPTHHCLELDGPRKGGTDLYAASRISKAGSSPSAAESWWRRKLGPKERAEGERRGERGGKLIWFIYVFN